MLTPTPSVGSFVADTSPAGEELRSSVVCSTRSVVTMTIGFLHPGAMGSALASILDQPTSWVSDGRSDATRARAGGAGMVEVESLDELSQTSDVIVSVCPPHAALDVADAVARTGFGGLYLDANAVAPATARSIASRFDRFVDGGIVGPPPGKPGSTRLYASGDEAPAVAELWSGSALEVRVVQGGPGSASAVKAAFASWTKGTAALLLAIRAFAEAEGVTDDILGEWATSIPELVDRSARVGMLTQKAWRFAGELEGLADAFAERDVPDGWQRAAAELYRRIQDVEGAEIDAVIAAVLRPEA